MTIAVATGFISGRDHPFKNDRTVSTLEEHFIGRGQLQLATKESAEAGVATTGVMNELRTAEAITARVPIYTPENTDGTPQGAVDAAYTNKGCVVLRNTYPLTTALAMRPDVEVIGICGGGLSRVGGTLVEFNTHTAHRAKLRDVRLAGGWTNGTTNFDLAINNTLADDVVVSGCYIVGHPGSACYLTLGKRMLIENNVFERIAAVGVATVNASLVQNDLTIRGNLFKNIGQHCISTIRSSGVVIEDNRIDDQLVTGLVVSCTAAVANVATFTRVSGPLFLANVRPGSFLLVNGGQEWYITQVLSDNTLVARYTSGAANPGAQVSVPAAAGCGDLINLQCGTGLAVHNNRSRGGVGAGILIWDGSGSDIASGSITSNTVEDIGGVGICTVNVSKTEAVVIADNTVRNPGKGTTAIAPNWCVGIWPFGNPGKFVAIIGNRCIDDQTIPTMEWGIALDGLSNGRAVLDGNISRGAINSGIRAGIPLVSLSASFGSTSTVTDVVIQGRTFSFTVNCSGTGQAASPVLNVSHRFTPDGGVALMTLTCHDTAAGTVRQCFVSSGYSAAISVFLVLGLTPVDTRAYRFIGTF